MEGVRSHDGIRTAKVPDLILYYDSTDSEPGDEVALRHLCHPGINSANRLVDEEIG
jgi:hypothetical protein